MPSGFRNPQLSSRHRRRHSTEGDVWNVVNRILMILVVTAGILVVGFWFYPQIQKRNEMARGLEEKKGELANEQLLRKQREREKFLLENDPEYIETIARDRLDLMKEGETIYRLDGTNSPH